MYFNKVFLIGRIGKDPEIKYTGQTGDAVATFSLAVNGWRSGRDNGKEAKTNWFRVVAFKSQAVFV